MGRSGRTAKHLAMEAKPQPSQLPMGTCPFEPGESKAAGSLMHCCRNRCLHSTRLMEGGTSALCRSSYIITTDARQRHLLGAKALPCPAPSRHKTQAFLIHLRAQRGQVSPVLSEQLPRVTVPLSLVQGQL